MALTGLTQLQPNNIQVVGIATFDQSVGIAGTLTYQDVTNVDAVGIVTARNGIDCDGDIDVDGHTNLDNVSIAGVTTMTGELKIDTTANNRGVSIEATGSNYTSLTGNAARTGADEFLLNIRGLWNDQIVSNIILETGSDTTNKDDGVITFRTASAGSPAERLRIQSNGDISFSDSSTGSAQIKNVNGNQNSVNNGGFPQYAFVGNEGTGMRRPSANVLCFDTTGEERIRIENNGRIAIGNHNGATHDIHIKHATSPGIRLEDTTQSTKLTMFAQDSVSGVGNFSNHALLLYTNSLERLRVQASGYVLVGDNDRRIFSGGNYPLFQVASSTSSQWGRISSTSYTNDGVAGGFIAAKSRSTTIGSHTVVQNNDQLGNIFFEGSDGDEFVRGAEIQAVVTGTPGNDDMPTRLDFSVTNDNSNGPTNRMSIRPEGYVDFPNNTYLNIPHDERCIVFDEGQKMITSNDGQGNFNFLAGKNHDAQHVSTSANGNSGISQIEMQCDGGDGAIYFGAGPRRAGGSTAEFHNGFKLVYFGLSSNDHLNGLQYISGNSTSPSGLSGNYPIIHKGNAANGRWNTDNTAVFKCLGDGGSIAITTNDGGGNCNVCFNHASETPDTNGSSWRITANIDGTNASMYFSNNSNVTSGNSSTGVTSRLEITHTGTFVGSSSNNISDVRLKKNIATITDATTKIKGLVGRTFEWKDEAELDTGTQYGFIAQEMETVVSDLVTDGKSYGLRAFDKDGNLLNNINHDGVKEKIVEYSKGVNIDGVVPILVEALKEAITRIETLETKVAALEGS